MKKVNLFLKKNLTKIVLILIVCISLLGVTSCGKKVHKKGKHTYDQKVAEVAYLATEATHEAPASYYYSCKCGEKGTETFTSGEPIAHVFDQKNLSDAYLAAPATHNSKEIYYYSCKCGAKGTETFEIGETIPHTFDQKVATDEYIATPATHFEKATYYYSCSCGAAGTETFESGEVIPHTFDQQVVEDKYLASEANHYEKATYYYSCSCGECGTETFESGEIIPHTFDQKVVKEEYLVTAATCEDYATYYYSCSCGECGTETFEDEEGGYNPNNHISTGYVYDYLYHYDILPCGHTPTPVEHTYGEDGVCTDCGAHALSSCFEVEFKATYYEAYLVSDEFDGIPYVTPTYDDGVHGEYPVLLVGADDINYDIEEIIIDGAQLCSASLTIKKLKKVTFLGEISFPVYLFDECYNLEYIYIENDDYTSLDKNGNHTCIIDKANKKLLYGAVGCVIPDDGSVEIIGDSAFYQRELEDGFVIPEGIIELEDYALATYNDIELTLPQSIVTLGESAIATNQTSIRVPSNALYVTDYAFDCENLEEIIIDFNEYPDSWGYPIYYDYGNEVEIIYHGGGAHTFIKKILTPEYLVSQATCCEYAVYYYSCPCGACGTTTFEDVASGYYPFVHPIAEYIPSFLTHECVLSCGHASYNESHSYDENGVCTLCGAHDLLGDFEASYDSTYDRYNVCLLSDYEGAWYVPEFYNDGTHGEAKIHLVASSSTIKVDEIIVAGCLVDSGSFQYSSLKRVTFLGDYSDLDIELFDDCPNLEYIYIENDYYTSLDKNGNHTCIIDKANKKLVNGAVGCVIPDDGSVEIIGNSAFYNRSGLTELVIPEGIVELEDYSLGTHAEITIVLPESIEIIGEYAICTNQTSIRIPANVSEVSYNSIECEFLEEIIIAADSYPDTWAKEIWIDFGNEVKIIYHDGAAHTYDQEATKLQYLVSRANCCEYAVYYYSCKCGAHSEETFEDEEGGYDSSTHPIETYYPSYLTHECVTTCTHENYSEPHIYDDDGVCIFCGAHKLSDCFDVTYSTTEELYIAQLWTDCDGPLYIPEFYDDGIHGEAMILLGYSSTGAQTQELILAGCLVDSQSFQYSSLKRVTFLGDYSDLDIELFDDCPNLEYIYIENDYYTSLDKNGNHTCIIDKANKKLVNGAVGCVIPDDGSVEIIGNSAFYNRSGLTELVIPEGIVELEDYSLGTYADITIVLPESIEIIGEYAICTNQTSIRIPANASDVAYNAIGCEFLEEIIIAVDSYPDTWSEEIWADFGKEVKIIYHDGAAHTYDQEVTTLKYVESPQTCTEYGVYYYSCKCGECGTETFVDTEGGYAPHNVISKPDYAYPNHVGHRCQDYCTNCHNYLELVGSEYEINNETVTEAFFVIDSVASINNSQIVLNGKYCGYGSFKAGDTVTFVCASGATHSGTISTIVDMDTYSQVTGDIASYSNKYHNFAVNISNDDHLSSLTDPIYLYDQYTSMPCTKIANIVMRATSDASTVGETTNVQALINGVYYSAVLKMPQNFDPMLNGKWYSNIELQFTSAFPMYPGLEFEVYSSDKSKKLGQYATVVTMYDTSSEDALFEFVCENAVELELEDNFVIKSMEEYYRFIDIVECYKFTAETDGYMIEIFDEQLDINQYYYGSEYYENFEVFDIGSIHDYGKVIFDEDGNIVNTPLESGKEYYLLCTNRDIGNIVIDGNYRALRPGDTDIQEGLNIFVIELEDTRYYSYTVEVYDVEQEFDFGDFEMYVYDRLGNLVFDNEDTYFTDYEVPCGVCYIVIYSRSETVISYDVNM